MAALKAHNDALAKTLKKFEIDNIKLNQNFGTKIAIFPKKCEFS